MDINWMPISRNTPTIKMFDFNYSKLQSSKIIFPVRMKQTPTGTLSCDIQVQVIIDTRLDAQRQHSHPEK
jgi:hypothetical protein